MASHTDRKKIILSKVYNFYCIDDLFLLADAYSEMQAVFNEHKFPIREYIKWLKEKK